ncbi:unnamed protein product [Dicrocoelium dendriticum]|nr:unnamed protein product [Dicrocoelium dendriticum]
MWAKVDHQSATMSRERARRGVYTYHAPEVKSAILRAYEAREDWVGVAQSLKVNPKTCRNWIREWLSKKPRGKHGGARHYALTDSHLDRLVEWVSEDPSATLDALRSRLKGVFDVKVSITTVSRYLDGRLILVQKLHRSAECENSLENKQRRKAYVLELMKLESEGRQIVWIDELNWKLCNPRARGRNARGFFREYSTITDRGPNVHIVGAMTKEGLIALSLVRGDYSEEMCAEWLRELLDTTGRALLDGCVLVCDNAAYHAGLELVLEERQYHKICVVRLSPYCPSLNPLEGVWSIIRPRVLETMWLRRSEILGGVPDSAASKTEWRMRMVEDAMKDAECFLTANYCEQMVQLVMKNHTRALYLTDL